MKGTLIYEGRTDSQVKVRGHRVDLSEVENAVAAIPGIDKSVVLCYRPGQIEQVTNTQKKTYKQISSVVLTVMWDIQTLSHTLVTGNVGLCNNTA